ncbi:hypothetical protein NL676_039562 [Syzygium grande]|nr:hypothetical protein NL676_039562 [Syzygium grande]
MAVSPAVARAAILSFAFLFFKLRPISPSAVGSSPDAPGCAGDYYQENFKRWASPEKRLPVWMLSETTNVKRVEQPKRDRWDCTMWSQVFASIISNSSHPLDAVTPPLLSHSSRGSFLHSPSVPSVQPSPAATAIEDLHSPSSPSFTRRQLSFLRFAVDPVEEPELTTKLLDSPSSLQLKIPCSRFKVRWCSVDSSHAHQVVVSSLI